MSFHESTALVQFHSMMSLDHLSSTRNGEEESQVHSQSPTFHELSLDSAPRTPIYAVPRANGHLEPTHEDTASEHENGQAAEPEVRSEDQNYVHVSLDDPCHGFGETQVDSQPADTTINGNDVEATAADIINGGNIEAAASDTINGESANTAINGNDVETAPNTINGDGVEAVADTINGENADTNINGNDVGAAAETINSDDVEVSEATISGDDVETIADTNNDESTEAIADTINGNHIEAAADTVNGDSADSQHTDTTINGNNVEATTIDTINGDDIEAIADTNDHMPINGEPEAHNESSIVNGINGTRSRGSSIVSLNDTSLPTAVLEPVMAPFDYINSLPSKGVRDKLVKALNIWIDASGEALDSVKSIVGDVHNLSLMLDDVQDNSPMRRARPATHCVFGMPQTVNSATYQIVDVISRALSLGHSESVNVVIDEMRNLLIGQAHDLAWTHLVSAPTVEGYLRMVDGKTGGLFRMLSRLMIAQSESPNKPADLDRLMTLFGRFFQIRDDYANLVCDQYTKTKGFAEDLDEGKYSFIVIHALLNADPTRRRLLESLFMQRRAQGCVTDCHKELVIELLHQTGSLDFTAQALQELKSNLEEEICRIEAITGRGNPEVRKIINALKI